MNKIELLEKLINSSKKIVVMTGAGFSKASGIPDFRSSDGLYNDSSEKINPEKILSRTFFINNTKEFFDFYFNKMIYPKAKPNLAHRKLFELEQKGRLYAIITQNIDGLHQASGCEKVLELHGTVHENYCISCNEFLNLKDFLKIKDKPLCPKCGNIIKPKVTLYEEVLDEEVLNKSLDAVKQADLLIVAGTSLAVQPASSLPYYFKGRHIVIINLEETGLERFADLVINDKVERVLSRVKIRNIDDIE